MVREDVAKLLEQKKFIEAEKTLQKFLYTSSQYSDEEDLLWQNLIEIQRQNNSKDLIKTFNYYVSRITSSNINNKNDKALQALEHLVQLGSLDLDQWIIYLQALWDDGQVQNYYDQAQKLLDNLVLDKNIPALKKVLPSIIKTNQLWPKPQVCLLMMHLFSSDIESAINAATELLETIESKWKLLNRKKISPEQYFERVLNILEQFDSDDSSLHVYKLKLRARIYIKFNNSQINLSKREIIELLITDNENLDTLLLCLQLLKNNDDKSVEELIQNIQKHSKYSLRYVLQNFPKLSGLFGNKVDVVYKVAKDNKEKININNLESYSDKSTAISKSSGNDYERSVPYICSVEEKEIITKIKQGDFKNNKNINDLALAFKELGYFEAAICLLKVNTLTQERLYVLCEVLFALKRFVDVIAEINDAIVFGLFESELPIEFKYLEAESYLKIGSTHKARKIYREIMLENPDFRQVKARYRNA